MTGPEASPATVLAADVLVLVDTQQKPPPAVVYQLPDNAVEAIVQVARATNADPSKFPSKDTHIVLTTFASYDGGLTWEHLGTTSTSGGITTHPVEGDIAFTNRRSALRPGLSRQLRVHQAIICGPATTLTMSVAAV